MCIVLAFWVFTYTYTILYHTHTYICIHVFFYYIYICSMCVRLYVFLHINVLVFGGYSFSNFSTFCTHFITFLSVSFLFKIYSVSCRSTHCLEYFFKEIENVIFSFIYIFFFKFSSVQSLFFISFILIVLVSISLWISLFSF